MVLESGKLWTGSFAAVCLSSFFIYLNVYMLNTTLPLYAKEAMSSSGQQMGLVMTLWSAGVVLLRLMSGQWIDRFGIRRLAVLAILCFLGANLLYIGISEVSTLLAVRILHGGSFAVGATATSALAANMISHSRKGEGIGYFSLFMSIAMVIGPAAGILLVERYGHNGSLFAAAALFSGLALLCILCAKPREDTLLKPAASPAEYGSRTWRQLIEAKAIPVSLAGLALSFSYSSLTSFISSYTRELQLDSKAGLFFTVFAAVIVASRRLVGKVVDMGWEDLIVYAGVFAFAAGMLMLSRTESAFMLLAAAGITGLGYGALFPCLQTLAVKAVPDERRGVGLSTFFLFFDLGFGCGSFVLGWTAEWLDYRFMYLTAAVVSLLTAVIYSMLPRPGAAGAGNPAVKSGPGG